MSYGPIMAIKQVIASDISGKENATSVVFGVDSDYYTIDLTAEEKAELLERISDYVERGRRISDKGRVGRPLREVPATTVEERDKIREWANTVWAKTPEGREISLTGRIPRDVQKAYDEAHGIVREDPWTLFNG